MDRLRPALPGGGEHRLAVEIALARGRRADADRGVAGADMERPGIGVGVDGNRPDPEPAAGAGDPTGDLAAIGDEYGPEHPPLHPEDAELRPFDGRVERR